MERLSKITDRVRLPLKVPVPPYLMDHHFDGKVVLPAVEAMRILAASTLAHLPEQGVHCMANQDRCDANTIESRGHLFRYAMRGRPLLPGRSGSGGLSSVKRGRFAVLF